MALGVLGSSVDVLVGGADLAYPHHAYQQAMAEAASGVTPFARATLHVGTVRVNGDKMAKSTGNLVLVEDVLRDTAPATLRMLLLDRPVGDAWDYDPADLPQAQERVQALYAAAARPGGGVDGGRAVARVRDGLDVPGAVDLALEEGGETARRLLALLKLAEPA